MHLQKKRSEAKSACCADADVLKLN